MAAFEQNWKHLLALDLSNLKSTADHAKAKWATLGAGITTITPAAAETADTTPYWDGEGFASDDVTGKAITFQIAGHRNEGDPAQDFVASKFLVTGDELKTLARWTSPEGKVLVFVATLKAIVPFGGAANVKQTFSFTLSMDGKPLALDEVEAEKAIAKK